MPRYNLVKKVEEQCPDILMLILFGLICYLVYTKFMVGNKVRVGVINEGDEHFTQLLNKKSVYNK